jgi:hypothetical protein
VLLRFNIRQHQSHCKEITKNEPGRSGLKRSYEATGTHWATSFKDYFYAAQISKKMLREHLFTNGIRPVLFDSASSNAGGIRHFLPTAENKIIDFMKKRIEHMANLYV